MKKWMMVSGLLFWSTAALAQVAEFSFSGGQSLLRNNLLTSVPLSSGTGEAAVKLKDGFRFGFRMTLNTYRFFGHEAGYAYSRTDLTFDTQPPQSLGMAIHTGFYNFLVYALPEGTKIRPFATGGVHFSNFVPPGASATSGGGETKFGVNYGGGIKVRVSPLFMLRLDIREYNTSKPDFFPSSAAPQGRLRQLEVSAGIAVVI